MNYHLQLENLNCSYLFIATSVMSILQTLNRIFVNSYPIIGLFVAVSVTILGDFLHFGQLFKAFGSN